MLIDGKGGFAELHSLVVGSLLTLVLSLEWLAGFNGSLGILARFFLWFSN